MNSIIIDNNKLSKFKKIRSTTNYESTVFHDNNRLYKILNDECRCIEREEVSEYLSKLNHPNCVFPRNKLLDTNYEFIGVEEEYLKGYKNLSEYINHNQIDFNKRQELAYKLCEVQYYLDKNNISFLDLHTDNIMTDGNNLKIIDLDSSQILDQNKNMDIYEYFRANLISTNLSVVCYQILFGYSFNFNRIKKDRINKLFSISNEKQKVLLSKVFSREKIIDVSEYIKEFDEYYMEESKLILKV